MLRTVWEGMSNYTYCYS